MSPQRVCFALFTFLSAVLRADTVWTFSSSTDTSAWTFTNGPEFPGARGTIAYDPSGGGGALVSYDFTPTTPAIAGFNPKYVGINRDLPDGVGQNVARIEVEASWSSPLLELTIQFRDATGQTFQSQLYPAFESVSRTWLKFGIEVAPTTSHWGGANDGVVHLPIKAVALVVAPPTYAPTQGSMKFHSITFRSISDIPALKLGSATYQAPPQNVQTIERYLGICVHDIYNLDDLSRAAGLGLRWVRTDLGWSEVETQKGTYNFKNYQAFLDRAKSLGMSVNFILSYGNPLYSENGGVPPLTSTAMTGYGNYAVAAAKTLGTDRTTFEIWNEPDNPNLWNGSPNPSQYAQLLKTTAATVASRVPAARTLSAGLMGPGSTTFIDAMQSTASLANCDGFGMHLYTGMPPEASSASILQLQAFSNAQTKGKRLVVSEWGYSSVVLDPSGNGHTDASRRRQACYLVRMGLLSWWHGLEGLTFYDLRDDGTDPYNREHNFGLMDAKGVEKPAAAALRILSQSAFGRTFVGMINDPALPPWIHVAALKDNTSMLYVLWSEALLFSNRVTIPLNKTRIFDLYGAELSSASQTGNWSVDLRADSGPIYISTPLSVPPSNWIIQVQVGAGKS